MFRLYRKLSWRDWLLVAAIAGLTVLQVYCTMTLVDYVKAITIAITYLNYQNNPGQLGLSFMELFNAMGGSWASFAAAINILPPAEWPQYGLTADMVAQINGIASATPQDLWFNGGMMVLLATGSALCQAVIGIMASRVAASLATRVRAAVNEKVSSFSLAEINRFSTASLATRATNDVQQVQQATLLMLRMAFAAPVTAIWAIARIQAVSVNLTIATAVVIVLLVAGIATIALLVMPRFKLIQKSIDRINGITQENLTGIRMVRAYNAEKYQEDKFARENRSLTRYQLFAGRVMGLVSPLITIAMNGLSLAIYWIGAYLINDGVIDYPTVTSFIMLSSQIIMSFMLLLMMLIIWPRASVCARRINEVLQTTDSIKDPPVEKKLGAPGTIEFRNVSFKYPDAAENVLENISFKAKKGDTIAFIGSTGSGKSTLINLVARLYDVTSGQILVDGVDVREMKQKTLRSLIGFVPQRGVLFSGTVKDNIAFGKPDLSLGDAQKAARIACADEFIETMDGSYEAPIAQGGTNVSGGQRQRICIARAVAVNPQFFVFDDSFSALDFKTDRKVRDNLKAFEKDATKLIVAQRIGTIMDADTIVVLNNGKTVGAGTHRELLRTCPTYREIALSQLSKEELGI